MAGLETSGSNPDVSMLYDINGLAHDAPGWLDRTVTFLGEYGLPLGMVILIGACWWTERRRAESLDEAATSVATVVWAPLAAVLAVLVNTPIRGFVQRPRPFADHEGLDVLLHGQHGYSFVSDRATLAMAVAAGLFVASRRFGLIGIAMALAEGFCQVFLGVHYPTDVIGGFALGTAVALLLSPLATMTLTPLMKVLGGFERAGLLVRPRHLTASHSGRGLRLQEGAGQAGRAAGRSDTGAPGPACGADASETVQKPAAPGAPRDPQGPQEPDLAA
ncbi:phosphatase PAP2 family protein [Streptomyces odontomachi]|uniref:phosphatase PAP2 family protein n=1 Tax=Streptomyces odontomachi TaxID=2944940 RepID=UPI00210C7BD4|nr:phosphatase PAP2 family protein [Streptomyces sp. ODS25]